MVVHVHVCSAALESMKFACTKATHWQWQWRDVSGLSECVRNCEGFLIAKNVSPQFIWQQQPEPSLNIRCGFCVYVAYLVWKLLQISTSKSHCPALIQYKS